MSDLIAHIAHPDEVLKSSNAQHRRLVGLLEKRDTGRAVRLMREHMEGTEHPRRPDASSVLGTFSVVSPEACRPLDLAFPGKRSDKPLVAHSAAVRIQERLARHLAGDPAPEDLDLHLRSWRVLGGRYA